MPRCPKVILDLLAERIPILCTYLEKSFMIVFFLFIDKSFGKWILEVEINYVTDSITYQVRYVSALGY
jgi:hypothetical protein